VRARRTAVALLGALALGSPPASGWFTEGHRRVTEDAVRRLGPELPASFRSGAAAIGAAAVDPDLWKTRAVPVLDDREAPDHYYNWELLDHAPPPERRSEALAEMARRGLEPRRVGLLPYAVVEGAERLALCFAELRRWPEDETIVWKCRLAAGWLAHYAGDLTQPLHTSIHHDGWANPDGASPGTGFHFRIDPLFERVPLDREAALAGLDPRAIDQPWPLVLATLEESHSKVDAAYALEPILAGEAWDDPRVVAFTCERYRATALRIAELFTWAWLRSAEIDLPGWRTSAR
jgi:hypothetical protein